MTIMQKTYEEILRRTTDEDIPMVFCNLMEKSSVTEEDIVEFLREMPLGFLEQFALEIKNEVYKNVEELYHYVLQAKSMKEEDVCDEYYGIHDEGDFSGSTEGPR